jgi:trk system potassium uptake protein TrkA
MHIIIVGCGRMGAELAYRLFEQKHTVVVVDQMKSAFDNIHPDFRGRTIEGEALNEDVLRRAGIEEADALAVVTNSDAVNAVIGHVAKSVYHVPRVVVRNYNSRWQSLLEAFNLPVISSTVWGALRIEELLQYDDMRVVFSAGNGEVNIYEFIVPESCQGCTLSDLFPEDLCRVVAFTRAGQAILPDESVWLEVGDILHFSASPTNLAALRPHLNLSV